ncbi:MAG: hypothetical protein C4320_00735, partial [Armatimonadota bacterium]
MLVPLFVAPLLPPADLSVDYRTGVGLTIKADGITHVQGSWFQYYAPGWTRGYYSSKYNEQKVTKTPNGFSATFVSPDRLVSGTVEISRRGDTVESKYRFEWNGDVPALVELAAGEIYAEPWKGSKPLVDGSSPSAHDTTEFGKRLIASNARSVTLGNEPAQLKISGSPGVTVFDAIGYPQGWAEGRSVFWAGREGIPVSKGRPAEVTYTFQLTGSFGAESSARRSISAEPLAGSAIVGQPTRLPLIPKPKLAILDYDRPLEITGLWSLPAGRPRRFDDLLAALARRFDLPTGGPGKARVAIDGGMADLRKTEGAYRITITARGISVIGEKDDGVRNGMERVAQLAFAKDGKLYIPTGRIEDEPGREFRGVHLFVGPQARPFQERLWTRVLRPLGLNRVVLQCERTAWDTLPGISTSMTMPKPELTKLFDWYRSQAVEPIPLVQSWGHAEWIFANGKNLELAYNRDVPYALDPRKPEVRPLLNRLWDEIIAATKAKTIHFGLDEVDMRGMEPVDDALVTRMWQEHLPFLGTIAKRHGVGMMLWGDALLAPGEAPDAAFGRTKAHAQARRDAVPKGTFIADWHYKADARPQVFLPNLQVLKLDGFIPIATTWNRPENIRGFTLAADLERVGTLQSTWAGYESGEPSLLANLPQFWAMVLSADYSWSARQDAVDQLGYDPAVVFRRMYF